jgi:hypothetical protein
MAYVYLASGLVSLVLARIRHRGDRGEAEETPLGADGSHRETAAR